MGKIELNLDREVQKINSEIYEHNERLKAQLNQKEPVEALIIRGQTENNTLWLNTLLTTLHHLPKDDQTGSRQLRRFSD